VRGRGWGRGRSELSFISFVKSYFFFKKEDLKILMKMNILVKSFIERYFKEI
jgi:hypothetical protein